MQFVFGKSLKGRGNRFVGDLPGLINGFSLGHLGENAGDRNGRAAAKGQETDIINVIILHFDVDAHHVATNGIAHFSHPICILHLTHVSRVLEVIHHCF